MNETHIIHLLASIGADIAAGRHPQSIFDAIVDAVQAMGFNSVQLDLLSPDELSISRVAARGFGMDVSGEAVPVGEDEEFMELCANPSPQYGHSKKTRGLVPLLLQGKPIGKLTVDNGPGGRLIRSAELDRVAFFANQAAIAHSMFWASLLESLQETTLAITSMRDRRALLNKIVEQAVKLLGAKSGGLYEYRPELGELTLVADFSRPEYIGRKLKIGEGIAGRIIQARLPYLEVLDYSRWEGKAEIYETGCSFGAVLEVPLRWEGNSIGVLYVTDEVGRIFSNAEIRLLQLFADHAAISLTNSNLLLRDAKKLQRLERLAQSTHDLMSDLKGISLQDRLMRIAQYAAEILQAESAGVFRVDGQEIVLEASYGQRGEFRPSALRLRIHNEPGGGLTGFIAYQGDLFKAKHDELMMHPAIKHLPTHSLSGQCYSLLAVPLKKRTSKGETLIGLIRADNKMDPESGQPLDTLEFTAEDASILTIFAEAAVVAIESAELVDQLKEQKDFQERLIDSAPDGIVSVNRKGEITEFNKRAEEVLGYKREEILETPVDRLYFDPADPRRIGHVLHEHQGQLRDYETAIRSKSGERIPIRHASTWLFDAKGERMGSVGYFEDLRSQRALERRAGLLLKASNVIAQADSLDTGLQSLADMIVSLLGPSFCCILIMEEDGESLVLRAASRREEPRWNPGRQRFVLSEWPGLRELLVRGLPTPRDRSDERVRPSLERLSKTLALGEDIQSLLVIPFKVGTRVLGQLDVGHLERDAKTVFPLDEIELVSAIAVQVAVLVDRMETLEKMKQGEALLRALVDASVYIRGELEMPKLLQGVVRLAAELVDCSVGGLFLNRPYAGQLELEAVYGLSEDLINRVLHLDDGVIGQVAQSGETVVYAGSEPEALFHDVKLNTITAVPLRGSSGDVDAVLFIGDPDRRINLGRTSRRVLEDFATQAGIALRTSRLIGQEQRSLSQIEILHRISDYIQEADELERILLTVLAGVTANFGLGFNRAMLFLVDEAREQLVGEMGIGELEDAAARSAWKSEVAEGFSDFEHFRQRLEAGKVGPATTVGKRIRGLRLPAHGDDLFSEVVSSKAFRQISVEDFNRVPQRFLELFRVTTTLAVAPLVAKREVIGILVVDNKFTQAPIGPEASNSLMTFAATAAIAIDKKRLFDQIRSDANKLVLFYQLSADLVSLQDSLLILKKIVEQTVIAAGASWVSIVLIDEAGRALNPIISDRRFSLSSRDLVPVREDGISMQVMRSGKAYPIENIKRSHDVVNPDLMEPTVQAAICLPLSLPGKRIGVMWIHYTTPRSFPESEVAALQLYVNQAAIAYDSARRIENLENIRRVSDALAEADDIPGVLRRIVEGARQVMKADAVVFWYFDDKTDQFIPTEAVYAGDCPEAWSDFQKSWPQKGGTAWKILRQGWISIENAQEQLESDAVDLGARRFLEETGGRDFQGISLKVGRERLGVLYLIYRISSGPDDEARDTAQTFANRAALELKKAKLLYQVQRAREAAEFVARVTLLEDPKNTLLSIAQEIREALSCGAVVLFKFDQKTGDLILPPAMAGIYPHNQEVGDENLVLSIVERDMPYIVPDLSRDENFKSSPFALDQGIKSCVATPLKAAGQTVGVMFVSYRNSRHFTADELTLIEMFSDQAAVAIRNAQLFSEVAQKLAQQEALSALSRELMAARSIQGAMDRAVKFAAEVLGVEFCSIVLPDREGRLIFSAGVGWEPEMVGGLILDPEVSQTGYTIKMRRPVVVDDFGALKEFAVPDVVATRGIRSSLSVPMFRERDIVGAMLVHTRKPHRFFDEDETLLSLIANQVAIALDRAWQYESSQRKSAYLAALYEASKTITASFGMDQGQVLEQILRLAMRPSPEALSTVWLYDGSSNNLVLESIYPPDRRPRAESQFIERRSLEAALEAGERIGVTGRTMLTRQPQLVPDVSLSSDYIEYDSSARSELAVPLLDQGKVIGVIDVESDRLSAFDEADVEALQALAELVVVAIQNNQRVQELTEAKQLVSTRTTLAWMGLSNVVSRHDMARFKGILLAEIYLLKAELERVGVSDAAISRRLAGIKKSIERELKVDRPPAGHLDTELSSIPVNELIRKRKVAAKRGLKIEVNCSLDDSARVRANRHWLDQVLDILVNNAVDATTDLSERKVSIGSRGRGSWVEIYVSDNGPGIPEKIRDKLFRESIEKPSGAGGLGIGLLIAQAIVQVYGGDISWEDRHPNGTTMIISLPLERA